ncbi:hypothetical protein KEJ27_04225 [Candidatus Bathyarchaeota archaeon]|nr:hypothetical protein [Candidatus Bathyarchaeota archaeon]MBS7613194.1 hypothetical protein [Candidatus Bathyarchaeota archaeon]MBS7617132.1 hypothetical protein [Candidatus Bathyarchaeota archaeon]
MEREDIEVIKVELPKWLAEKFWRYVAEKYGFRRGVLSKAMADMIERELETRYSLDSDTIDGIVSLGLSSDYKWNGEDLVEALGRKYSLPDRR